MILLDFLKKLISLANSLKNKKNQRYHPCFFKQKSSKKSPKRKKQLWNQASAFLEILNQSKQERKIRKNQLKKANKTSYLSNNKKNSRGYKIK